MQDHRADFDGVIAQLAEALPRHIAEMDERPAQFPDVNEAARAFDGPLPEEGVGAAKTIERMIRDAWRGTTAIPGPRCFHFVIGGTTPAALGADILATAWDQPPYTWITSPIGLQMELTSLEWLKQMLGMPADWTGVMVTGASMANFTCYATARQWWGEEHGVDVAEAGMQGLPPMPVFSSGYIHASSLKTLGMLGIGRGQVRRFTRDAIGRIDPDAMRAAFEALDGAPALVVVNAGEVNAGDFDPLNAMVDIARDHNAWVHVDGAFGLFARTSPRVAHLVDGIERVDSATVDGHKWLNVPYDAGYAFTRDHGLMARAFRYTADYLPAPDDPRPTLGAICPESSRRARGFASWATLAAYGRKGVQEIVEHCLDLAQYLARLVDEVDDMERLADVQLNVVSFRYNPGDLDDATLDEVNRRAGEALIQDGRVFAGITLYDGKVAHRPTFSNWRTRDEDVDLYLEVVRELSQRERAALGV